MEQAGWNSRCDASGLGGCNDVDAHEMIPVHLWEQEFGDAASYMLRVLPAMELMRNETDNNLYDATASDVMSINDASVWGVRGIRAPSAIDMTRRLAVMDCMGISRQLVFGGFAAMGANIYSNPMAHQFFGYDGTRVDRMELGRRVCASHNEWAIRKTREIGGASRARIVAIMLCEDIDSMMDEGQLLLASGLRAVMIPNGGPPAGLSPADRCLDPFWRMFADANVPVLMHIGTEFGLLASQRWDQNVPQFESAQTSSAEFPIQPFWGSTINFASENFIAAMVLGGVFERIPNLRFGSIEATAHWIGPLAERLDMWAAQFGKRLSAHLSRKPSTYINRNIRVSTFPFEDVASYFERYPQLSSCYCFATDFPHREGGKYSKQEYHNKLATRSNEVVHKFFVDNGAWLLPQ